MSVLYATLAPSRACSRRFFFVLRRQVGDRRRTGKAAAPWNLDTCVCVCEAGYKKLPPQCFLSFVAGWSAVWRGTYGVADCRVVCLLFDTNTHSPPTDGTTTRLICFPAPREGLQRLAAAGVALDVSKLWAPGESALRTSVLPYRSRSGATTGPWRRASCGRRRPLGDTRAESMRILRLAGARRRIRRGHPSRAATAWRSLHNHKKQMESSMFVDTYLCWARGEGAGAGGIPRLPR